MKKKLIGLLWAGITSLLLLSGCSLGQDLDVWVLGTASPEDTVTQLFAVKFAEEVDRLSGGELKVEVFANSSLGGDTELLEGVMSGDIPFVVQNTAPQVSYLPKLCLFDLPCVFDEITDLHTVLDNEAFMEKIRAIYAQRGIALLGMGDQNFRVMTSNVKVADMADFSGIKIRTMENSYHMAFWTAIGASPTPMTFSEVYIGLQQHTIDAQENPYEVIVSNKFYEQQDYVIQTNHLPHLLTLITNQDFLASLPQDQQDILTQAAQTATEYSRRQALERANDRIAICEEGGAQLISLSPQLREEIRSASSGLYEQIRRVVDDDGLYDLYVGQE